jgi:hypothetical protein
MAARAKRSANRKVSARKPAKKSAGIKSARKTASKIVKSASKKTTVVVKSGKGLMRRAVDAIAQVAAPLMPGSAERKSKEET